MVHIESLNVLVQVVSLSLFFTDYPEGIIKKWFFMLGQITALSIIYINHVDKCFHELFVDHLFGIQEGGGEDFPTTINLVAPSSITLKR